MMSYTERLDTLIKESKLIVSDDKMTAELYLCKPPEGEEYDLEIVKHFLTLQKVTYGVQEEALKELLNNKMFYQKIVAAKGKAVIDGVDGRYEYLFDTESKKKPKVLEDGSVDYGTMTNIPTVAENDVIVRYYPPQEGEAGYTVTGVQILPRKGKTLPELRGKGFRVSEDHLEYIATLSGKIVLENERINITNLLEIKEDVDLLTGDINFDGDILIHGNVTTGRRVHAGGNLTVEGFAEPCGLSAKKDIVLKNGMQGGGKAYVKCDGSVMGKFFEQVRIKAGKNVNANSLLGCDVLAGENVEISGKQGVILGGNVFAYHQVIAENIGSNAEVNTFITAGDTQALSSRLIELDKEQKDLTKQLEQARKLLELMQGVKTQKEGNDPVAERKLQVMRMKITLDSHINENKKTIEDLMNKVELASDAKVIIHHTAFPGTVVKVNGAVFKFTEPVAGVTLGEIAGKIYTVAN